MSVSQTAHREAKQKVDDFTLGSTFGSFAHHLFLAVILMYLKEYSRDMKLCYDDEISRLASNVLPEDKYKGRSQYKFVAHTFGFVIIGSNKS
jgi:hypothetical protein